MILLPSGENTGAHSLREDRISANGEVGVLPGPRRSTRQILVRYSDNTYARRLPRRETAIAKTSSAETASLRGFAETEAATRQRLPPLWEPEENTISSRSGSQAAAQLNGTPVEARLCGAP